MKQDYYRFYRQNRIRCYCENIILINFNNSKNGKIFEYINYQILRRIRQSEKHDTIKEI